MVSEEPKTAADAERFGWWVCACVKRRKGVMSHIRMNAPTVKKCRVCGCAKPVEPK